MLLSANKQWGEATLNSAKTLPISFSQSAYCAVGIELAAYKDPNTILKKLDLNSVYFENGAYSTKCNFIALGS